MSFGDGFIVDEDEPVYDDIIAAVRTIARMAPPAQWYGFGSYFNGHQLFSDIDLLAVCQSASDSNAIRAQLNLLCGRWPVHLLIMTAEEVAETNFIVSQRCVPLEIA